MFGRSLNRDNRTDQQLLDEALNVARRSDIIIAALRRIVRNERGKQQPYRLEPPDVQQNLLKELLKTGKPVVLVLFTGRPLTLNWEQDHVPAILNVWFGGSEAAYAIGDVLFGDVNPSGKLTMTFPKNVGQIPLYYAHKNTGRPLGQGKWFEKFRSNYLDVDNEPLYPFGYGLSYTTFSYSDIDLSHSSMDMNGSLTAAVTVTNTGTWPGSEVVQLYIRDVVGSSTRPVKELKGFQKIFLEPGEMKIVRFKIAPETSASWLATSLPDDRPRLCHGRTEGFIWKRMEKIYLLPRKPNGTVSENDRFAYPHWWYGDTGKVKPFGQKDNGGDLVETAFIMQALLSVHQYYIDGSPAEQALAARIDKLWREVDWNFYRQNGQNVLYWHWSPEYGWEMNFPVHGYNECLIMYILAAASPTHGVPAAVYHEGWAQNGAIVDPHKVENIELHLRYQGTEAGPLFWAQYSFLGLDPIGLKDEYCANYFDEMRNLTLVNRAYCVRNPKHYKGFGPDCWGLTASYSVNGYAAHAPNERDDQGVISPTAALSSIVYTPEQSLQVMRHLYEMGDKVFGPYGFYDAFSETDNSLFISV